jgi:hypothetical protein
MPNNIDSTQLAILRNTANAGDIAGVYTYLQQDGYQYAGLALGVASGNTVSGAAALGFLNTSAQLGGVSLTDAQITKIKSDLANAYLDFLGGEVSGRGFANTDLDWKSAWNIHTHIFAKANLPADVWTLNTPFSVLPPATCEKLWNDLLHDQNGTFISTTSSIFELGKDMQVAYSNATDPAIKAQIGNWFSTITTDNVLEGEAGMFFNTVKGFMLDSTDGVQNYTNQSAQDIASQIYPALNLAGDDPNATAAALVQAQKQANLQNAITKYFGLQPGALNVEDDGTTLTIGNGSKQVAIGGDNTIVSTRDANGNISSSKYDQYGALLDTMHVDAKGVLTDNTAYGTDGALMRDTYANGNTTRDIYDPSGHLSQQNNILAAGGETDHLINADGSQSATVLDANGHKTEYASFGADGVKTQDLFYDAFSGRLTHENDFNADGSQLQHFINADGTQNTAVFNASGHQTEYEAFDTNGAKTQDLFYDALSGRLTHENDFNADGSQVQNNYNIDGTRTAFAYDTAGHETELATFDNSGKMTQALFYDPASGRLTQDNEFNADGSQLQHLLNADGTQNTAVFNASGHQTEYETFGTNGAKTQDLFFDATTGRETQENDFNVDGSQVHHAFNGDGTQTANVFNATGRETEQATFGTNSKLSQDLVFDGATGQELQETDYNATGGGVAHVFNPDGTQNAAVFDPSGHVAEYAAYDGNGSIKSDAFFDANGRETQLNEYAGGQTTIHLINADHSQTATVYNSSGHETEFAKFNASGQKTDDSFFDGLTGRETEYDQYGNNGSMAAHLFNGDNTQNAIMFNGNGQEMEYDSFDNSGNLTGFTQFTYGVGGGYNAVAYGPTGYEAGWADYSSDNMVVSSGGGEYNFTLGDEYGSGSDNYDFASWSDEGMGYSADFGYSF